MAISVSDQDDERRARLRAMRPGSAAARASRSWAGEPAAIYCRISHVADQDQTGVERQERICQATAERLGLAVDPEHVYVDNNRSAWKRSRKRSGWDAMLAAAVAGKVRHIVAYHPDRLMRQPKDLEALLDAADEHGIVVHGEANRRDLADPDDRFFLRLEVAHACRSSDDTSRRIGDAMADRAYDGKPHAGPRALGYSADGMTIVEDEAETVRRIFHRFQAGHTPNRIATDLNTDGITTITGKPWVAQGVSNLLRTARYAGILVFHGEQIGQRPGAVEQRDPGRVRRVDRHRAYDRP